MCVYYVGVCECASVKLDLLLVACQRRAPEISRARNAEESVKKKQTIPAMDEIPDQWHGNIFKPFHFSGFDTRSTASL